MSVVARCSAPQMSYIYTDKAFNFCVVFFCACHGQEAFQGQSLIVFERNACTAGLCFLFDVYRGYE